MTTVQTLQQGQVDLRRETGNLVKALRQPAARGQWGEMQLRNAVEAAGMLAHCDFAEQVTVTGEDGRLRPDLVVRLPGGGQVVVDAKVPLLAFLDAVEAEDEDTCRGHLANHARLAARAHDASRPQGVSRALRALAGVGGALPVERGALLGGAAAWIRR